ncbi:hypothetical protein [Actinomyces sp. MRS3W]|uniref:hypothetical protein n=1 Tax=Actinomyces sp. MRS3W TaxID=2800796 RepID=UPI0029057E5C|nr:hypothetical protein [Actinomyces sp. MRS3W]
MSPEPPQPKSPSGPAPEATALADETVATPVGHAAVAPANVVAAATPDAIPTSPHSAASTAPMPQSPAPVDVRDPDSAYVATAAPDPADDTAPAPEPGFAARSDAAPQPDTADPAAASSPDTTPLATVHRLRPLPDLPRSSSPAAGSPAGAAERGPDVQAGDVPAAAERNRPHGLAPVAWDDADATFSDGIPVPEEPGDPDGPGPAPGAVASPSRLSAAQAAARAAARGGARNHQMGAASAAPARSALEDDLPSEDDEDAEEAGVVGLEVVKRLLGATVLEEVTVTQEGH